MWARSILAEMGYNQIKLTISQEDNKSKIHIINNHCNTQKTKLIEIRYNFVPEQVQKNNLAIIHLSTKDMTSDILTKVLSLSPFLHLQNKLLGL